MFSRAFWADAAERAVKTFFQSLGAALVAANTVAHLSWTALLITAGSAALLSLCSSVASLPIGGGGTASMLRAVRPGRHEAHHTTPEVTP